MKEEPEFKPEDMISKAQLMSEISTYADCLAKKDKNSQTEEVKPAKIIPINSLSDEEVHELLSGTEISGEKIADTNILTIIRNFEADKVDSTIAELEEIFISYKELRLITQIRLLKSFKEIGTLALKYTDKKELKEKEEAFERVLKGISNK